MTIYAAEPGSPTEHALALLASWAATPDAPSAEPHTRADERAVRRTRASGPGGLATATMTAPKETMNPTLDFERQVAVVTDGSSGHGPRDRPRVRRSGRRRRQRRHAARRHGRADRRRASNAGWTWRSTTPAAPPSRRWTCSRAGPPRSSGRRPVTRTKRAPPRSPRARGCSTAECRFPCTQQPALVAANASRESKPLRPATVRRGDGRAGGGGRHRPGRLPWLGRRGPDRRQTWQRCPGSSTPSLPAVPVPELFVRMARWAARH